MDRPKTTSYRKERKHSEKNLPGMCTGVGKIGNFLLRVIRKSGSSSIENCSLQVSDNGLKGSIPARAVLFKAVAGRQRNTERLNPDFHEAFRGWRFAGCRITVSGIGKMDGQSRIRKQDVATFCEKLELVTGFLADENSFTPVFPLNGVK